MEIDPNEALAELCRRKFYRFVREFWDVVIAEEPVFNWHIEFLCDELQYLNGFVMRREPKPYDLVVNISPGTTKTTIFTVMYNAWVWTVDPAQRIITSSHTSAKSLGDAVKTRDILQSPKYKKLFPNVRLKNDENAKGRFRNDALGERFSSSTKGGPTGNHAHQVIIDDPLDATRSSSEKEREAAEISLQALSSRKVDKEIAPTILVMQRLHESDPTGILLSKKNKRIKHICLPAEVSDRVNPPELKERYIDGLMDPVRLNREVLAEAKEDLGSYGYAGQFGQTPAPEEGGIFKKDWFDIIDADALPPLNTLDWKFTADTAYTKDEENDPSSFLAYAIYNNDFIVREVSSQWLEFPELVKALPTFVHRNGYTRRSIIQVEPKASGKSAVQTIKRETSLNIKEAAVPTRDKTARAKDVTPIAEAGRVKLLRGLWNKPFLDQLTTFPNAEHDDEVDCFTIMLSDSQTKKKGIKRRN